MLRALLALTLVLCCLNVGVAAERPEWAFFVPADSPRPSPQPKSNKLADPFPPQWSAPGSNRSYTSAQLQDPLNPPDWYPNEHPQMPSIVARGLRSENGGLPTLPCALCHLPNGAGH